MHILPLADSARPYRRATGPSPDRQRGMTAIGMLIIAVIVGLIGFAVLKLVPLYLEHYKVVSVLEGVKDELDGQNPTRTDIRKSIEKRMVVESLNAIDIDDVRITKENPGYLVSVEYEQRTSFIANLSFIAAFDKTVEISL